MSVITKLCNNKWKKIILLFCECKTAKTQDFWAVFTLFGSSKGKSYPIKTHKRSENWRIDFPVFEGLGTYGLSRLIYFKRIKRNYLLYFFSNPDDVMWKWRHPTTFSPNVPPKNSDDSLWLKFSLDRVFWRWLSQNNVSKTLTGKRESNILNFRKVAKNRFQKMKNLHVS